MQKLRSFYHNPQFWLWLVFIFSFLGLLVSSYLWYLYAQPQQIGCSLTHGCESVRNSEYSSLWGIQLPVWGMLFYFGLCAYVMSRFIQRPLWTVEHYLFYAYALAGLVFSAYFTYLELFVIKAICQWCVMSAIVATLAFAASGKVFWDYLRLNTPRPQP